jgi:AbrB family looped-hinge helix DNA binding protein
MYYEYTKVVISYYSMNYLKKDLQMTLMRIRNAAQLTLPSEVRKALNIKEGDYLEASIVSGGVLLKPVSVVERDRAWTSIVKASAKVKDKGPRSKKSNLSEERTIAREVKALRRQHV